MTAKALLRCLRCRPRPPLGRLSRLRDRGPLLRRTLQNQTTDAYRRIRNTLRILLGNLDDFDPERDAVAATELTLVDRWILERLHAVTAECLAAYAEVRVPQGLQCPQPVPAPTISAPSTSTSPRTGCTATPPDGPRRRATQTRHPPHPRHLCRLLAPITAYTADEAWEHMGNSESVHLRTFPSPDPDFAPGEATAQIDALLKIRGLIQQQIEIARQEDLIGSNNEAAVTVHLKEGDLAGALLEDRQGLMEFLILSDLSIVPGAAETTVKVAATDNSKCPRCWRQTDDVGQASHEELCGRCAETFTG